MKYIYQILDTGEAINVRPELVNDMKENELLSDDYYNLSILEVINELCSTEFKNKKKTDDLKLECLQLLEETDHKISLDYEYQQDIPMWTAYRNELRKVLKGTRNDIPSKPF